MSYLLVKNISYTLFTKFQGRDKQAMASVENIKVMLILNNED
jgi:hypothetical protein